MIKTNDSHWQENRGLIKNFEDIQIKQNSIRDNIIMIYKTTRRLNN